MTDRRSVDEDDNHDDKNDENDGSDNMPLVELPDDVLEGLQWGAKPRKGRGRTTVV